MKLNVFFAATFVTLSAVAEYSVKAKAGDDLVKVRDEIRAARKAGRIAADEPVTVTLAPGTYLLPRTLTLEAADSGTEAAPVVWRAEKKGTVRFLGGRILPRAAFASVSDAPTLARLDAEARGKVVVTDVASSLAYKLPEWKNLIGGVLPGPWLYYNGEPQTLARWPNADAPDAGWFGYSNLVDKSSFAFPGDRAARWNVKEGVWLNGYWKYDWYSAYAKIADYDRTNGVVRLAELPTYGLGVGGWPFYRRRFYAVNLLEELDRPGEWYFERTTKRLFWYPLPARGADEIVLAQDLVPFVRLDKAAHVRFEGLSFEYSHGGTAFVIANGRDCIVCDCAFLNHAGKALEITGWRNRVTGCTIRNIGGTVLSVDGGDIRSLLPANNMVDNCTIDNFALFKRTFSPGIDLRGCGNAIRNNTITRSPYIALWYYGNEHLIADNEFGHVVLEAGDSGAIYSGYNPTFHGTLIVGNYIHDLAKTPEESLARNGIYFDDCDWGDDVIGNTFVHAGLAVFFGGGKLHGAYNNLMRECRAGVHCDSRGRSWRVGRNGQFGWDAKGDVFARRNFDWIGADYRRAPWRVAYPALEAALDDHPELPGMNTVTGNVIVACTTPFHYDAGAQLVMGKSSPGNLVVTNAAEGPAVAPQPVRLRDAAENVCRSADGSTAAVFALDASGHFCWSLSVGGRRLLDPSPLGITVGFFDHGRRVVPGQAEARGEVRLDGWKKGTVRVSMPCARDKGAWKNAETNVTLAATAQEWRIPLRSLITGETVSFLDVRVWKGGAAYRWTVPGQGVRKVYGENGAFIVHGADRSSVRLVEFERNRDFATGYPESFYYERGEALGISFPECAGGWNHDGEVVTPWRAVLQTSLMK